MGREEREERKEGEVDRGRKGKGERGRKDSGKSGKSKGRDKREWEESCNREGGRERRRG